MSKERKQILLSAILMIVYVLGSFIYLYVSGNLISKDMSENISNIISYVISITGIVYFLILMKKDIDLNKHYKGIMFWSIIFFIVNIVSGVLGFMVYGTLDTGKVKKEKRELPKIEISEYTNKYICLVAFLICIFILMFGNSFMTKFWMTIASYLIILLLMIFLFRKQLVHDFKLFREYFREYSSLVFKTWGKSLLIIMITSLSIQIITGTTQANNQINLQESFNVMPVFIALLSIIYAPIAEELMFRGVIRKFIKNDRVFIIVSGILFGLLHVIDDSKTLAEFSYVIVYSALGVYLSSLYAKTNNICTNIFMHMLQNTLGVIGMLLLMLLGTV